MNSIENAEDINKHLNEIDNGEFKKLMNIYKDNDKEFNAIFYAVTSEDKYPRFIPEYSGLEEVRVSRENYNKKNKLKTRDQNIVRLFTGPKKKQVLVAQYSFKDKFFQDFQLKDNDIDIFHHTDMDGDASASILYNFIKRSKLTDSVYTYRYNYNGRTLDDLITRAVVRRSKTKRKNTCFIVDLSITAIEMTNIMNSYDTVILIDHHQTSLEMINSVQTYVRPTFKLSYAIDTRCCATYLALSLLKTQFSSINYIPDNWNYPKGNVGFKTAAIIDIYDLKLDKKYPEAYKLSTYMNQYYFDYKTLYSFSIMWKNTFSYNFSEKDALGKILKAGKKLEELERMKMKLLYDNGYIYDYTVNIFKNPDEYPYQFNKVRFRAIYGTGNSSRFIKDESDIPEIDFLIRYRGDELVLVISAYTDNDIIGEVDLSKLFSKYNMGGGHKKACGGSIFTDDIYELLINIGEDVNKEYWTFGNDSSFNHFIENKPKVSSKMRYKNWKIDELKSNILKNKDLFAYYTNQLKTQSSRIINDDDLNPIDPCLEYEMDVIVRLLVRIYAIRIYNYLMHNELQVK